MTIFYTSMTTMLLSLSALSAMQQSGQSLSKLALFWGVNGAANKALEKRTYERLESGDLTMADIAKAYGYGSTE